MTRNRKGALNFYQVVLAGVLMAIFLSPPVTLAAEQSLKEYFPLCYNEPLPANGLPATGRGSLPNNWLACLSMFCSEHDTNDGCQWYRELASYPMETKSKSPITSNLVVRYIADDELKINYKGTIYSQEGSWTEVKTITVPNVTTADEVLFTLKNKNGPAGIVGEITWNGETKPITTSTFVISEQVPFNRWSWSSDANQSRINSLFPNSVWIWKNSNPCENCHVTLTWIAGDNVKNLFTLTYNADDRMEVYHNGIKYTGATDWQTRHQLQIQRVKPGDVVTIRVVDFHGLAGWVGYINWNGRYYHSTPSMFPGTIIQPASDWDNGVSIQNTYPGSYWIWGASNCRDCYTDFNWMAPFDGGDVVSRNVQEMKNFIAIQQLEHVREAVLQQVTSPPGYQQVQYSGYKAFRLGQKHVYQKQQKTWQLMVWDLFNGANFDERGSVVQHFSRYCSYFDAELDNVTSLCGTAKMAMPWDIVAASLLGETTIAEKENDYVFERTEDSKRTYVVRQSDMEEFQAMHVSDSLPEPIVYSDVKRQQAALTYIRNLTNAVPLPMLDPNKLFSDKKNFILNKKHGIPYVMAKYATLGYNSLARESLLRMYLDRIPDDTIRAPNDDVAEMSVKTSLLGLLEYESTRRLESTDWHTEISTMPYNGILKEVASLTALELETNYRIMSHLERIEALFVAMNMVNLKDLETPPVQPPLVK